MRKSTKERHQVEREQLLPMDVSQRSYPENSRQFSKVVPLVIVLLLSLVQGTLAVLWGPHWVGLAVALVELIICIIGFVWVQSLRSKPGPPSKLRFFVFGTILTLFAVMSILYLAIYVMCYTSAPATGVFPDACPKTTNCVRLTLNGSNDNQSDDIPQPIFNRTIDLVRGNISEWIESSFYVTVFSSDSLVQVRAVTTVMGFVDDFFIQIIPYDEVFDPNVYTVNLQSQSRIGISDFGVNKARVNNFLQFMDTGRSVPKHLRIL